MDARTFRHARTHRSITGHAARARVSALAQSGDSARMREARRFGSKCGMSVGVASLWLFWTSCVKATIPWCASLETTEVFLQYHSKGLSALYNAKADTGLVVLFQGSRVL
eukprot:6048305-Amphidinium_carterae.1